MPLTLKEAIQSQKLKLIATELEPLARKDRTVKKIVDTLKKGQEPNPADITSLKGDTQDDVVMAFASVLGPSRTSKFLGEEKKTIKVGEDAVGAKKPHYVIVKDRKVIAKGDKKEMMEKCGDDERVWLSTKDVGDMVEGKEDPDIGDRKGSQPASYHKGLAPSTKEKRDAQFKKQSKMSDDDPNAYKPAPGDKEAKTKPSQYTKKYDKMFGESTTKTALEKKSEETGIAYSILKDVYDRGVAAWRTGHRPGTTPAQWGMARVNSFVTGGKTQKTTDADLWKKHKGQKEEFEMFDSKLTESVRVATNRYKRAHGKDPKGGTGSWYFTTKLLGEPKKDEIFEVPYGEYKKAKEMAQKWAKKKGASIVYVMEANAEDMMPASPDEKSMALKQAEFIQYVGREIGEHLVANKEFPEWMQNKLSALHQKAKDMHSTLGAHGETFEEKEMSNYNYRTEAHSPMHVSKAIRIAEKMGGDMTGAVEKIEKMSKGLSDHPKVKAALRMANEEVELTEKYSVYKPLSKEGRALVIVDVKTFNSSNEMDKFLSQGSNKKEWKETGVIGLKSPGKYRMSVTRKSNGEVDRKFMKGGIADLREKAESEAQAIAARIALKHKREGTKPEPGTASAEMMKMSEKDLEDFTKVKKGAPEKVQEAKMSDAEVLSAAKALAANGKDEKAKKFGQGLVDFHKENGSFTPDQVAGLQNIMKNASFQLAKEELDLMESHFKVGDKVTCIASGMKGEVIKLDEPQTGKYYTVRRDDGKVMKYAADELKKVMKEAMDPVDKEALKKKFKARKDKDIDNDGDVDSSDEYLHKRRSAISKAIAKEESETKLKKKDIDGDGDADDLDKSLKSRQQKVLDTD